MKIKKFKIGLLLVGIAVIFSGETMASDSIKVGILLPLSGPLEDAGHSNLRGHQYAVHEINRQGGIASLNDSKIELIVEDTQGDMDIGLQKAEKLIRIDKVISLIGAYQTTVTYRTSEVAERENTPYIISTALSDILTQRGQKYVFRTEPNLTQFVEAQYKFLKSNVSLINPKIALVYERTLWGQSSSHLQRVYARKNNYQIVADLSYSYTSNDLDEQMKIIANKLLHNKPDVVLQTSYLQDSIAFARSIKKVNFCPKAIIATGGAPKDPQFIEILGKDADGWLVVNEWSSDMLRVDSEDLDERFYSFTGYHMNGISAVSYVSTWILKEALERIKKLNKEDLRNAIANLSLDTGPATILPGGRVAFDSKGNNVAFPIITQIIRGYHKTIWPPELSVRKPILGKYFQR